MSAWLPSYYAVACEHACETHAPGVEHVKYDGMQHFIHGQPFHREGSKSGAPGGGHEATTAS